MTSDALRERIDNAKQHLPVEAFILYLGGSVSWGQGSGWGRAHCPFHKDEHPSASVSPDNQYFKCLGCGASGDIIDLVKQAGHANTATEAVEWIEEQLRDSSTTDSS